MGKNWILQRIRVLQKNKNEIGEAIHEDSFLDIEEITVCRKNAWMY